MKLTIGLSSWIIQDGNFPEIEVGSEHRMALEFYAKDGLRPAQGAKSFRHVQGVDYEIVADVIGIFEEADTWSSSRTHPVLRIFGTRSALIPFIST
jgi:hypothetical protein